MHRRILATLCLALGACGGPEAGPSEPGQGLHFDRLARDAEPPAPLGRHPTRTGGELPVRHYPSATDDALVLVHGSGSHSRYLAPLGRRIAASGRAHVYTPDLRGHGEAPERRGDIDHIDQLEEDLADLVGWIRTRHPGRVFVGGHSSGGGLALRYAGGRQGADASGFVLLAPFLAHDAPTMSGRSAGGWARPRVPRIVLLSILNGFGIHAFDDAITIEFEMPEAVRDGTETLAYSHRLNTGYAPRDWKADLAAAPGPILVLVGDQDEAFLPEAFGPAVRGSAPEARVELIPGAGHLDLPAHPATAERILQWLSVPAAALRGEAPVPQAEASWSTSSSLAEENGLERIRVPEGGSDAREPGDG